MQREMFSNERKKRMYMVRVDKKRLEDVRDNDSMFVVVYNDNDYKVGDYIYLQEENNRQRLTGDEYGPLEIMGIDDSSEFVYEDCMVLGLKKRSVRERNFFFHRNGQAKWFRDKRRNERVSDTSEEN